MVESKRPPVEVGETLDIEIESLGKEGDGIGRHKGFVIIVSDTQVWTKYPVKITKVFKSFAIGKRTDI